MSEPTGTATADPQLVELAAEQLALESEKRELKARLNVINKRIGEIEPQIIEGFISAGLHAMKHNLGTLYIQEEIFPALKLQPGQTKDEVREKVIEVLRMLGHEDMITFNQSSMKALVKGLANEDGTLPPPLGDYMRTVKEHRLGARNVAKFQPKQSTD